METPALAPHLPMREVFWLALLVAGIALGVWVLAPGDPSNAAEEQRGPANAERLLPFALTDLDTVEIVHDGRTVRIARSGGRWSRAGQDGRPATGNREDDRERLARFLGERLALFAAARIERSFEVEVPALADYGVAAPRLTVRLHARADGAALRTLEVGERTPDGFGQYVHLVGSGRMVIVPAYHVENLRALASGP